MKFSTDIRQLFRPFQPAVSQSGGRVVYEEIFPHADLQGMIFCYWQLKTTEILTEPFVYRVVADGCIDIYFELHQPEDSYVMGFCKKFTEFPLENTFHYVGIRFIPTAFPQLFGVDASTLSNRYKALKEVVPTTASYIAKQFNPELSLEDIRIILDGYFIEAISGSSFNSDKRIYDAIEIILSKYGMVDIEQDLDTGLSPRQIRRYFQYYIGSTAKTFAQVVRFQNILMAKPSLQSLRQNKLFFDVGYYDQSHFIKEFKNFYGVSPSKAFGR